MLAGVTVGALALGAAPARSQGGPPTEAQIKAVFLYNFTKYVDWPVEAFRAAADPLTVCVLGVDPFGSALEDTLRGEAVNDRKLAARHIESVDEAGGCQLLYVSSSEERELTRILKLLQGKPILTVGEMNQFAESGGMINLRTVQNKIRFDINEGAASRAGLKISSQLLKLGRIVSSGAS